MDSYAKKLKSIEKERRKKERFLRTRMWISTLMSTLYMDRGSIPSNIGNNIQVLNNEYITKNFINVVILIKDLNETTPVSFTSDIVRKLKGNTEGAIPVLVDFTMKSRHHSFDGNASGLDSRIKTWKATLKHDKISSKTKRISARLLLTVDIVRARIPLFKTRMYITLRAKKGTDLNTAIEKVSGYLDGIGAEYRVIKSDLFTHLEYISLACDKQPKNIKDIPYLVTSAQTMSEMLPTIQGMNDFKGTAMGVDRENNMTYFIDFTGTKNAKNILVGGLSGYGKTFIVNNWMIDFFVTGYNIIGNDIKGVDLVHFAEATGGKVFDCTFKSKHYVNSFKLKKEEVINGNYKMYYNEHFNWSKKLLCLLTGFKDSKLSKAEALFEEFLRVGVYDDMGVIVDNPNTWERSLNLDPFVVFDKFEKYCSQNVRERYNDILDELIMRLRIFLTRSGSNSHMFMIEYDMDELIEKKVIIFNFGMIDGSTTQEEEMFNVHFLYSTIVKEKFIYRKFSRGEYTVNIDEESNSVPQTTMIEYSRDFTIRRSQNCVNILLCNSLATLDKNPYARGVLDTVNIMCVGVMHKTSQKILIEEFGLEEYEKIISGIKKDSEMDNTFILVNNMQKKAPTALLKVYAPKKVVDGKFFTAVTESEDTL